ncbi:site-specific integrase [Leptotrichia sp. OH3620_COT-345]|uniref:tyrosine-type recombinase/integrase n=1 Tax=Leptotrichia sp. OH3620_COT-345 TaxID=2491048 RepID=UPI000F648D96|nr:site-specific integrase [Leptotrichia sp. OH3620_COT-345]RRD39294.1 site-specific integrase [Leptotrichia sp. OH3620_COT-345]
MTIKNKNGSGSIIKIKNKKLRKPYLVRVTVGFDKNGKQDRKSLGYYETKKEAIKVLEEYLFNPYDIDGSNVTFQELFEYFLKMKKGSVSDKTYNSYYFKFNHCKPLHYLLIKDIRTPQLQELVNKINLSSGSKIEIKRFLVMVFEYAVQMEYIPLNRAKPIKIGTHKPVKQKSIFTIEEIKRLWENSDLYNSKMVLFMIYTGLRIGEMANLKKRNVDLINGVIKNMGNKTEKSKNRIIPLHNDILKITKEILEQSSNDYFICIKHKRPTEKHKNTPNSVQTIRVHFLKLMESLGMSHVPHDTRGTLASILEKNNISETIITDLMGHTDIKTTQDYYIQNDIETIKNSINKIKIFN